MQFNPNLKKQAQEVTFSKKAESNSSLPLIINKTEVANCQSKKHLELILYERPNFTKQINNKVSKYD